MLRDAANRLAPIAAALQLDRGRWIWLLAILLVLDLVLGLGDSISQLLRYDRSAIAAGGWWRLLTAHIVHLDVHHLVLNELGLVLMWSLFAQDYDAVEWCAIVSAGALAISSGLWWLSPRVTWYVGVRGSAYGDGRGRREALCAARLGSVDLGPGLVREAGVGTMGRERRALDRRRCSFVWGPVRIRRRCRTVLEDGYNSPPFRRPEALSSCHLHSFFPVKVRSPSA